MRIWLACLFLVACAPKGPQADIHVIRMATLAPARPAGCKVEFLNVHPGAAMLALQQLGMITVQYEGALMQAILDKVRDRACALGGDTVTFNTAMEGQRGGVVQFLVFKRGEEAPPPAEKKTGTEL